MASLFGEDGGTLVGGRRRPTNAGYAGYGLPDPAPTTDGPGPFGGPSGGWNPNPGGQQPTPPSAPTVPAAPSRTYAQIPGLDLGKLQNEAYHSYKYGDAARAFSSFVGGGGTVARNALDDLVNYARSQFGLKGAHTVSDDKVDFGEGSGPVDLVTGAGGLWWGQEDPFTTAAGGGSSDPFAGFASPAAPPQSGGQDMSWLADLLKTFAPQQAAPAPAPATMSAPPLIVNQTTPQYSQPSPTFTGGYVSPGFSNPQSAPADATSLLSMALPRLLQDPNAMRDPLVRQILSLMQGR